MPMPAPNATAAARADGPPAAFGHLVFPMLCTYEIDLHVHNRVQLAASAASTAMNESSRGTSAGWLAVKQLNNSRARRTAAAPPASRPYTPLRTVRSMNRSLRVVTGSLHFLRYQVQCR